MHTAIIHAPTRSNADQVELGLQANWRMGAERLAHAIDIFGERGSWLLKLLSAARPRDSRFRPAKQAP